MRVITEEKKKHSGSGEDDEIKIIFQKKNWLGLAINWVQAVKMLWKPLIIFSLDYYWSMATLTVKGIITVPITKKENKNYSTMTQCFLTP